VIITTPSGDHHVVFEDISAEALDKAALGANCADFFFI
jgi:hypothetical protein